MDFAAQKRPSGHDHRSGMQTLTVGQFNPSNARIIVQEQIINGPFEAC
jgi:hypothetical protein